MSTTTIAPPPTGLAGAVDALVSQIDRLTSIPPTTATVAELGPLLVRLEHAQHRLAGIAAEWLVAFDAAGGPEEHGAPSLSAWSRRELRTTASETQRRTRRAHALLALPATRAALASGRIGVAQVDAIAHGVHLNGAEVIEAVEPVLLQVAQTCDADAVKTTLRKIRDTLDPDAADAAYLRALERRDVTVTRVGEGFVVRGFLDPETGVAFKEVLYSLAKKQSVDDDRPAGHRRLEASGAVPVRARSRAADRPRPAPAAVRHRARRPTPIRHPRHGTGRPTRCVARVRRDLGPDPVEAGLRLRAHPRCDRPGRRARPRRRPDQPIGHVEAAARHRGPKTEPASTPAATGPTWRSTTWSHGPQPGVWTGPHSSGRPATRGDRVTT